MNKRIRNKYQTIWESMTEMKTPINNHQCKKLINILGHRNQKAAFVLHDEDLANGFSDHNVGQKYHAEDCNRNNPNNPLYWHHKQRPTKAFRHPK